MHYFLFPFSSPPPLYIKFWNLLKLLMPEALYHHFCLCSMKANLMLPHDFKNPPPPRGGGLENATTFGRLRTINPKFDLANGKRWNPFEVWHKHVPPVRSHSDCQRCTMARPWHSYWQ